MIKIEKQLDISPDFDFDSIAPKERIVFFDIETTGLSAEKAGLYLIGTVTFDIAGDDESNAGKWILRQFFAEEPGDEQELLAGFFGLLSEKKKNGRVILISYNGDGFDIPFIKKVTAHYMLPYDFSGTLSLDMMKAIRPYKKFLGLCDCRLKTVEKLCGINREDKYSGGELIYVYEEYLHMRYLDKPENAGLSENNELNRRLRKNLLDTLLLHNAEDIADMPMIMGVFAYDGLLKGRFEIESPEMINDCLNIRARLKSPLTKGIYIEKPQYTLSVSEEDKYLLELAVTVTNGEMKYFFSDYKNYYYLIKEDCAVHKSVGEFVDRSVRRQAKACDCYQREAGAFIPENEPVFTPVFYREYRDSIKYARLQDVLKEAEEDKDKIKEYILSVLKGEINGTVR